MLKKQDLAKLESLKGELHKAEIVEQNAKTEEIKPKKPTKAKVSISEEKFRDMLDDHLTKVKELLKAAENNICYRVWNSFRVELKKQLNVFFEYKNKSEG